MDRDETLKQIAREVSGCTQCTLHHSRKHAVPGEGPADAEVMFIGEGPGFHENEQGRPFVGAAGKFLDELLASIHLKRNEVFICNVVKCRPPGNRDPLPEEIAACALYLNRQIAAIEPHVIVTLGRYSMAHFMPTARISAVHGKPMRVNGRLIVPMYHPAAALHQPSLRETIERDFSHLPELIAKERSRSQGPEASAPAPLAPAASQLGLLGLDQAGADAGAPPAEDDKSNGHEPKQLSLF